MKAENRVTLLCIKKLMDSARGGIYDKFEVVVSKDKESDSKKKEYARQGYKVV